MRRGRTPKWSIETLEPRQVLAANPIISEFVADNDDAFRDGNGDSSDWVEIYNAGDESVDLFGWHLSDDAGDPAKWSFPHKNLAPGEFLIVFASGQETPDYVDPAGYLHTDFRLNADGGDVLLTRPNSSVASQFLNYPPQRQDIAYGAGQVVTATTLLEAGDSAKVLIPTALDDAAIGSSWTGAAEPFTDSAWTSATLGVGYETPPEPPAPTLQNVAVNKPATSNGVIYPGMTAATLTDGNRSSIVHGNGNPPGAAEAAGFHYTVDLGQTFALSRIDIYPRQDGCCADRLTRYRVTVHADAGGAPGAVVWSADMRTNGSTPAPGPTPPDTLAAALDPDGLFEGRWVRVESLQNPVPNYALQLGEIEVFALVAQLPGDVNQALGKPVTTSGPLWPSFADPTRITDGNPGTFTHPAAQVSSFSYTIDLGSEKQLDRIRVVNRGDGCCPERLTNYRVSVHVEDDGEFGPAVWSADVRTDGTNSGSGGVDLLTAALDESGEFAGRFIVIAKIDDGSVHYWPQIAEVEVFSPTGYEEAISTDVETAMKEVNASAYVRIPFTSPDPEQFDSLTLRIRDDDGFVAYLNGVEVARRNAPSGTPAYNAAATAGHFAATYSNFSISLASLAAGQNVLAIHGLNLAANDADFLVLPELIARTIETGSIGFLTTPTPENTNGDIVAGFVADTTFSVLRGFYDAPMVVDVTTFTPGATIVYTTDGSVPTLAHGTVVPPANAGIPPVASIPIATTTVLRAAAFKTGLAPTNVDTQTYLFLEDVIRQPALPAGFPATWNGFAGDYQMDPDVVNNPAYSDEIVAGLQSIRTMSIVMDPQDFLGSTDGIYTFPEQIGLAWERPISIEVIEPDGTTFFQEDAGIRVWGTGWRPHTSTLKHSFQLKFKDIYGNAKLNHQLFPDAPVDRFDDLILRAQGSRGWTDFRTGGAGGMEIESTQYIHDAWARDTAVAMGKHDGHATYVHLYINGLYWGLYNPVERPTGNFGEEYFGGDNDDYDVLSHRVGQPVVANEGSLDAWNNLLTFARGDISSLAAFQTIEQSVDIDNLIDYILTSAYATNHDGPASGNNMRVSKKRDVDGRFRFYFWDMEYTFWNPNEATGITDVNNAETIGELFTRLRTNPEFRQRFSDRAYLHLTGDGALTPAKAAARWQARADEIYTAVIAESARWGDFRRPNQPYTRDVEWAAELNRLMTTYFPVRTQILIDQLVPLGLFPTASAPTFDPPGGTVSIDDELTITSPPTPVYIDTTLVASNAPSRAFRPADNSLGITWTQPGFAVPAAWLSGNAGIGFDNNTSTTPPQANYLPYIGSGLLIPSGTIHVFLRTTFGATNPASIDSLKLRMRYDDGFVAYLNGTEIARQLAPGSVGTPPPATSATVATGGRADNVVITAVEFDVTAFKHLISNAPGAVNVLAIHGLNASAGSNDLLIQPELVARQLDTNAPAPPVWYTTDGSDPRLPGGAVNPTATLYSGPIPFDESRRVIARGVQGTSPNLVWGPPQSQLFTVALALRVDEIMYHPLGDADAEFIELVNVGSSPIDLEGVHFTAGIEFMFPGGTLQPGERTVVVRNMGAFEARYGTQIPVAGEYTGSLNNAGETIALADAAEAPIHSFTYDDTGESWHADTDGLGPSLVILDPQGAVASWSEGNKWRPSFEPGGSPGVRDQLLGDFNGDDRVDLVDLSYLATRLGTPSGAARLTGDLDGDGAVTRSDVARFAARFGRAVAPPPPSPQAPPEAAAVIGSRTRTAPRIIARRAAATDRALVEWSPTDAAEKSLAATSARRAR